MAIRRQTMALLIVAVVIGGPGCNRTATLSPEAARAKGDELLRAMSQSLGSTQSFSYTADERREQEPVVALQAHVSYTLRPRLWVAMNSTWYSGGQTTVDGIAKADLQRNSRLGATVSLPIGARQSVKVAYSTGATTRIGGDFETLAVGWQIAWIRP